MILLPDMYPSAVRCAALRLQAYCHVHIRQIHHDYVTTIICNTGNKGVPDVYGQTLLHVQGYHQIMTAHVTNVM